MAGAGNVSITGDKELLKALGQLKVTVENRIMRKALRAGAKPVRADARANAPFDSGLLKKNIKTRSYKGRKDNIAVYVGTGTRQEMGIEGKWYYPAHVELGHKGVSGVPFLRNALKRNTATVMTIVRKETWDGIRKEAQKLANKK